MSEQPNKKLAIKMVLVMFVITALSGFLLSTLWEASKEKIAINKVKKITRSLKALVPKYVKYKKVMVEDVEVYKCYNKKKSLLAYFFLAKGKGYQSDLSIAVSVDPKFYKIIGIRVLEQMETPGLGAKIVEDDFINKFSNINIKKELSCIKESADKKAGEVQAITGATISSKSVVNIIKETIDKLKANAKELK